MAVFIIIISIALIYINYRALKKDKISSFSDILAHKEESISDIQFEVGKLRREFSETILELQKEIIELKARDRGNESNKDDLDIKKKDTYFDNENVEEFEETDENETIQVNDSNGDKDIELASKKEYPNDIEEDEVNKVDEINNVDEADGNQPKDKVELVKELINQGYDDDKICESLSIGKGEVLLIRGLLKNSKS
ncbi:hypothetical protein [Clostridium sp. 'White wine YQ']|uniref:hypothetical protein n=1 Tax=Clostridium sp. 'White wine YQ' TaxID=3027474 RepID=UPI0023665C63|nr:hypothetical protein [Clostridium sp. 'White wine YQ']MDD7794581.1 hypothetical protein [Clostridium sp. 'White wine YQ']